jgi:peptidyl-prolyl cis-trans isomerase C
MRLPLSFLFASSALAWGACQACSSSKPAGDAALPTDAGSAGLTPEQAQQVLARVGQRTITLGDYAAALERMDPFERMRYQTEDRRQALLDEMINVELLAREAERRGLDREPQTQELIRQFQRDELLRRLRASAPEPSEIPAAEVREYYAQHRADFYDSERRHAAQIVLTDAKLAARVLAEARGANAEQFRALVARYNPDALPPAPDKTSARPPLVVPGDMGVLTAPESGASSAPSPASGIAAGAAPPSVPEAVRRAVFQIAEPGQVFPEVVSAGGRFYVVRLVSKQDAHQRSLEEADTALRLRLVQEKRDRARADLIERLRHEIPIVIDEAALEAVAAPAGSAGATGSAAASAGTAGAAP